VPGFFESLTGLIEKALDPAASDTLPPAPDVIGDVTQWLNDLKDNSVSVDGDLNKLQRLLDKFTPPDKPGFGDSVLVRMLQHSYPRVAGALTLLGVIEYHPEPPSHHVIRWDRVQRLLSAPQGLFKDLETKAGLPDPTAGAVNTHLLTVHLAALLLAPRPLLRMEHDGQGTGALPVPPAGGIKLADDSLLKPLFDSPWLFKLEVPTPAQLQDLKPDGPSIDAFLAYLKTQDLHPENLLPDLTLPTLPTPTVTSPPLVLPKFTPGSLKFGAAVIVNRRDDLFKTFTVAPGWKLTTDGPLGTPGFNLVFDGATWNLADVKPPDLPDILLSLSLGRDPADQISLFNAGGLFAEVDRISAFVHFNRNAPLFSVGLDVAGLRAGLRSQYLGLIGLNDALQVSLDLDTRYDQGHGLRVQGIGGPPALGIDFVQPIDQSIGAGGASLTINQVRVRVETSVAGSGLAVRTNVRISASAVLGPVTVTIADFGAWAGRSNGQVFGALAPSGVGVDIDAGIVQGGGFLVEDPPTSARFLGALALKVLALGVGAFGIYEKTATGRTSFVVIMGARFPGIQLGFGFMLTGLGGMVGINRRADLDQLSARLSSGAAGNVLFCEDPVRNAPALFGDLAAFFPPADGIVIVGPTLQLGWLYILRLDIGVLIELPGPSKIIVVGSARAVIPGLGSAVPLVYLRIDILGGVDFTASLIFFDASLVDSSVLAIFTLTGDAAFRFSYGASPYVLLSIGGFHPSYNPEPIKIRRLARASAGYSINVGVHIWMRSTFYFAFTPNTLQLGGGVEAGLEIGPVAAHGHFAFDALVQFKPFYFVFSVDAGFDIEFEDISLCSVNIHGTVSGPGPLVISASVSFKVLFVRFSFDQTFSLGSGNGDVQRVDVAVLDELLKEVPRIENVHAEDAEHAVILKKTAAQGIALVSASSRISWTQRLAPFDVLLERYGGAPLSRQYQVSLDTDVPADTVKDVFGLGSYANVTAAQSLNNDTFHREKAGVALSSGVRPSVAQTKKDIRISVLHIPTLKTLFDNVAAWHVSAALHGAVGAPGGQASVAPSDPLVKVHDESWQALDGRGGVIASNGSAFGAFQAARVGGGFAVPANETSLNLARV
jgi:hypothetical protein